MDSEVLAVNYWKETRKDLKKILSEPWKTLLLFHNSREVKGIVDFIKKQTGAKKILYISLTKTDNAIRPYFQDMGASLFIVDCVSGGLFEKKNTMTSFYENPPSTIDEMSKLNEKYISQLCPDYIILDSLSQFIDFSTTTPKNTQNLYDYLNTLKNTKTSCKFILLYMDTNSKGVAFVPSYDVDIILKMEVIVDKVYWNG
ncbi:MAG: hypothetical protein MPEBLZ_02598 [Candidatus Methanoperedens nitroreducens]|uniref:KaiC-like domain-containing protein n=1 Tax=Candidatus Methanoperedens nitratireducens TaxID=1392998 RepID=A0A0P8A879_9EURY|nr:hypothetical protein [Candidatus Methanoperedens sp. BLZ2]KAB2945125.1 MAG: hypothetical protein F9K14_12000 [Candidatus Methanoperedens sp.]KPQ42854.1 MAG: hypothetical protein MPEBLZ_02598 [Candidatus Methanoperedens sp. BLZ1]MBZ0176975.1 hypothetical protein [Candidatus Methanoperedens nitroreducens]CAG1003234.1 hypothetical protein METP2_03452 [Methanosarcinales archaeon]MCX9078155.1 hypothetical protein [Candidatus Methanoperedens sp.]